MGVTIPSGYGSARFVFQNDESSKEVGFTLGFNPPGDLDTDYSGGLYDMFSNDACPGADDHMITGWSFIGVDTLQRDDTDLYSFQYRQTIAGSITGSAIPANCAVLIKKSSSLAGKQNRGRLYCPGIWPTEGSVDGGGNIQGAQVTQMQGWWTAFFDLFGTPEFADIGSPVILHDGAGTPAPIGALTVQPLIATQRRRLR